MIIMKVVRSAQTDMGLKFWEERVPSCCEFLLLISRLGLWGEA